MTVHDIGKCAFICFFLRCLILYHDFPIANKSVSNLELSSFSLEMVGYSNLREALMPLSWTALTWEQQVEGLCDDCDIDE